MDYLKITAGQQAMLMFDSIDADTVDIDADVYAKIELNGRVGVILNGCSSTVVKGKFTVDKVENKKDAVYRVNIRYFKKYPHTLIIEKGKVLLEEDTDKTSEYYRELTKAYGVYQYKKIQLEKQYRQALQEGKGSEKDSLKAERIYEEEHSKILKDYLACKQQMADDFQSEETDYKMKKFPSWNSQVELHAGLGTSLWHKGGAISGLFSSLSGVYQLKPLSSRQISLNLTTSWQLTKSFSVLAGLGWEDNVYTFKNNVDFDGENLFLSDDKTKDKLVARYFTLPVMLEYRFAKSWALYGGIIGGINYNTSFTGFKRHYIENGRHIDEKLGKQYANFNRWKLQAEAGISYHGVTLYFKQSLTPVFKTGKERKLYPFSLGIAVNF
ncbi:MAG: outer membrane beta-barrel protein [Bacteroidales bacterium]|nr:outer membrane beta-barrel protein [Bacteroidales bacterium]